MIPCLFAPRRWSTTAVTSGPGRPTSPLYAAAHTARARLTMTTVRRTCSPTPAVWRATAAMATCVIRHQGYTDVRANSHCYYGYVFV